MAVLARLFGQMLSNYLYFIQSNLRNSIGDDLEKNFLCKHVTMTYWSQYTCYSSTTICIRFMYFSINILNKWFTWNGVRINIHYIECFIHLHAFIVNKLKVVCVLWQLATWCGVWPSLDIIIVRSPCVLLLLCNQVLPTAQLGYWLLNWFLHQTFLVRRVARHTTGLKTGPDKGQIQGAMNKLS